MLITYTLQHIPWLLVRFNPTVKARILYHNITVITVTDM